MEADYKYPLVSVIIPAYNRAHLIEQAIKSVLKQTYSNIELIIVDDASTDDTETVIKNIDNAGIKYIKQEQNKGAAAARNRGIRESNGEFISFLDSDDTYQPEKIEKQVKAILSAPEKAGAVYCGINKIDYESGRKIGEKIHRTDFYNNFKNGSFFLTPTTGTVLARKEALITIGGFDETLPAHQDTEIAIRFCQKYDYLLLDECLVNAVKNHEQISSNPKNHILAKEIIFKKHKDFLSRHILYGMCKEIANYYIHSENIAKAKYYIKESIKIKPFIFLTILQYILLSISPKFLKSLYRLK